MIKSYEPTIFEKHFNSFQLLIETLYAFIYILHG